LASSLAMELDMLVDVSYAAPQAHEIVNLALHREYSPGIVFIFSQGRKDLYHV
jgi:predicted nicotinamide N-methyase